MQSFDALFTLAAKRKGGTEALEALLPKPASVRSLSRIGDDRWFSAMTKCVFQAGFNWKVVEKKWPGFEQAFDGFNPTLIAAYSDDDLDTLMKDTRVIRQWRKLKATRDNARFLAELAEEHGSAARFLAAYPVAEYQKLLLLLKKRGAWLGGTTAQYFLRSMGKDSFILSKDVVAALKREKVLSGEPTSISAMADVQSAFNIWVEDGGESLMRVSRVLAFTVDQ